MFQRKWADEDNWQDISEERVTFALAGSFKNPQPLIEEMKANPGREIRSQFSFFRWIEKLEASHE